VRKSRFSEEEIIAVLKEWLDQLFEE